MANKFKTLDKMVYNLLLEKIKNGELVANEHLAEEKLAREFGVSRSPIRKAIATLTAQGIVSYHENSGAVLNDCIVDSDRYVQLMEPLKFLLMQQLRKQLISVMKWIWRNCMLVCKRWSAFRI